MRMLTGNAPNCCPCKATGGVKLLYRVHITDLTSSATHFIKKKKSQLNFEFNITMILTRTNHIIGVSPSVCSWWLILALVPPVSVFNPLTCTCTPGRSGHLWTGCGTVAAALADGMSAAPSTEPSFRSALSPPPRRRHRNITIPSRTDLCTSEYPAQFKRRKKYFIKWTFIA